MPSKASQVIPSLYIPCHSPSFARDLGAQERVKSLHTPTF